MASEEGSTVATPTVGKMSHSYSLPVAVDAVSLPDASLSNPSDAKQRSGKMLSVAVTMLDDIQVTFHVQHKALGLTLFELVCKQLSLLEVDYFGLEYEDANRTKYWLDLEKPMNRQLGLSMVDCSVQFGVKFYTPDPAQLEEEYTRYLFGLQIKKDLMSGTLQCNDNTAALMASYIVQADCGDYVADDYPDHSYLASYKFVPHQDEEMERRIMDHHKRHIGQSPAQADLNLLETVRRCELYGIRMHPAKDHEGVPLNLAVAHMGVLVFQNFTKINTFSWAKVRKLSFKRKRFLIKLHPEGYYKDTVEFYFESRNECKNFWKKCVEHHGFFRCNTVKKLPRQKARVLSRGSSFRYSGRTQKQIVDYVRENYIKRQPFQRSQSFRHSSSAHSGLGHVPNSRSSQPLYPVGDHSVGTPASHSCGSMVLNDDQSGSTEEAAAGGTSPSRTRGETSVTAATADVHSESMASGELSVSSSSSPKRYSSDQPQRRQSSDTLPIANGRMETDESIAVNKGGENDGSVSGDARNHRNPLLYQSSTDSPVSRGSSTKDRADDSVSQDSYRLLDTTEGFVSVTNGGKRAENEQGKGMTRFEGDPGGNQINGEIPYVLKRKRAGDCSIANDEDVFAAPRLPSVSEPMPASYAMSSKPRVQVVETDHFKITQSSPILYARSRLRSDESSPLRMRSSSGGLSPKSPRSLDFVHLHSLPCRHSFSSKDDSLNRSGSLENQIAAHMQRKRKDRESSSTSASSLASSSSTQSSRESATLEQLRIVEDGDDDDDDDDDDILDRPFSGIMHSKPVDRPIKSYAEMVCKEDHDEWEKLAPTFPPPPPPPLQDISPPVEKAAESIQEARSKFLISTISNKLQVHSFEEVSDTDNDATITVEESSDTGEQTTVVENIAATAAGPSVTITELDFDYDDVKAVDAYTAFGAEDEERNEENVDDTANGETESLPRETDLDDDDFEDLEPCPPMLMEETILLYPVRTLSRISEHSTSEQSESKDDSTPTQESKPSEDRHPSVGELPSDYSMSDDNPEGDNLSSNESECSPSRGRAPGTGSGLGLSPIRSYETVATIEPEVARIVLFDNDGEGSLVETYYMEIDSIQEERLEKEGVFYKAAGEESSSADNDTLCEEHSFMETVDFMSDVSLEDHWTAPDTHKELYEGLAVCIPARSPIGTPEPTRSSSSDGAKPRHRTSLELHVSKGVFSEKKPGSASTTDQQQNSIQTVTCDPVDNDN